MDVKIEQVSVNAGCEDPVEDVVEVKLYYSLTNRSNVDILAIIFEA